MNFYNNCNLTPLENQCCDNCNYTCNGNYQEGDMPECWEPYSGNPWAKCPCQCGSLNEFIDQGYIFEKCKECEHFNALYKE